MLELSSLEYGQIIETPTSIETAVSLTARVAACPACGGRVESKGRASPMEVWDTPAVGKHVRLQFVGRRYQCLTAGCPSFTDRGPDIHPVHGITWRLWTYIQRLALKRSIKDIHRLTGATVEQIRPAIDALGAKLAEHRFETPRVVAVDDIRFGKKRRFSVIYNAENGHALAIVEKLDAKGIADKLHAVIDPAKAEVFVSDMNGSNLLLGESSFRGKPHVADKWHVLDKMQRQMSRVVNQTANKLKKGPAAELKAWKMEFEGKFAAKDAKIWRARLAGENVEPRRRADDEGKLTLKTKWDMLKANKPVRLVYHARLLLRHVYRASSRRQAEERFDRFLAFGTQPGMPAEAAKAVGLLGEHRKPILAYFDAMWRHHDGRYRGPTTNQAEARNAKIKAMWKQSRGVRNPAYLNLRVVFEPYVLGATLILCNRCGRPEVLSELEGLRRAGMDVRDPRATRCSTCSAAAAAAAKRAT
jgi:transposase